MHIFHFSKKYSLIAITTLFVVVAGIYTVTDKWQERTLRLEEERKQQAALLEKQQNAFLEVHYYDIGRGDAILINYSDQYKIIVDGGASSKRLDRFLWYTLHYDSFINLGIITHPHYDHYNGFIHALDNYTFDRFLVNHQRQSGRLLEKLASKNILHEIIWQGENFIIDEMLEINFIHPNKETVLSKEIDYSADSASLAFRLDFGEHSFLFAGDIDHDAERDILDNGAPVQANFFKVNHHGYERANSKEFIDAVSPKYAFITQGNSPSSPTTWKHLEENGAEIYEIRDSGTTIVTCYFLDDNCSIEHVDLLEGSDWKEQDDTNTATYDEE